MRSPSFTVHRAEHNNELTSLQHYIRTYSDPIYKQGPSFDISDFGAWLAHTLLSDAPRMKDPCEYVVYASGKPLVMGPGRNGTSSSATLHAAYTVMPRSTLMA